MLEVIFFFKMMLIYNTNVCTVYYSKSIFSMFLGNGNFIIYRGILDRTNLSAKIFTPFYNFNGGCLEFFYFTNGSIELKILKNDKNLTSTLIEEFSEDLIRLQWKRVFLALPNGSYKLELLAIKMDYDGYTYIAIDDIQIWPCRQFRKYNKKNIVILCSKGNSQFSN